MRATAKSGTGTVPKTPGAKLQGYVLLYHRDIVNVCPGCGQRQWLVGRLTAECAYCDTALPLAGDNDCGQASPSVALRPDRSSAGIRAGLVWKDPGARRLAIGEDG